MKTKFSTNMMLKQKLIVIFILLSILPAILTAGLSLYQSKSLVEYQVSSLARQIAKEKVAYIDSFIEKVSAEVDSISKNPDVISRDTAKTMEVLRNVKESDSNTLFVYIGNADKEYLEYPKTELSQGFDPTTRPWYKKAEESFGNIVITEPYQDAGTGKMIITVAKAFKLADGKTAVAAADVSLDQIQSNIMRTKVGEKGYAALLTENGTIIVHPTKEMILTNIAEKYDFGKTIVNNKSGNLKYRFGGEDKISGFEQSKLTGWIAIATMPQSEYATKLNKSIVYVLVILAIISVLAVIIGLFLAGNIANPILLGVSYLETVANGDFTGNVAEQFLRRHDEIGRLAEAINKLQANIRPLLSELKTSVETLTKNSEALSAVSQEIAASSNDVAKAIQEVASGASNQAQDLQEIVSLIGNITTSLEKVYNELGHVKENSEETSRLANTGKKELDDLISSISGVREAFEVVVEKLGILKGSVGQVGEILEIIKGIAEQTNLLALNAAIEAARAGDAGRGFAVVADEIRKLAEQTRVSSDKISALLNDITSETDEVVKTSEEVTAQVNNQLENVENTIKAFDNILESVAAIAPMIKATYTEVDNTVKAKDIVLERVENISAVSEETSASAEEISASAEELAASTQEIAANAQQVLEVAKRIEKQVEQFKV